jgi:hypothetical protein
MPPVGKIEQLDDATRDELNRLLVQYRHSRLDDVRAWLLEQGHDISRPTIGRYSKELKDKMDARRERAMARIEMHRALGGLSDDDRASLMEAGEMAAYDEVLDLFDRAAEMEPAARAKLMPDVVKAMTALSTSAKKTAEYRKQIEADARRRALEEAAGAAKEAGASDATVERIRELLERGG